jgi:hypothetical protein
MTRWIIFAAAFFTSAIPAGASLSRRSLTMQDSAASSTTSPSAPQESPAAAPSPAEPKKAKKVWTNENLDAVSASPISLIGDPKNPSGKKPVAKPVANPATPAEIANFRKQLATLDKQVASVEKEIADLQAFLKGEKPGAVGLQAGKRYSTEPIPDQLRKLDEKKKSLAAQMDAVVDAARKRGVESAQLR